MEDSYGEKVMQGGLSREEQRQAVEMAGRKYYYTSAQEFDDLNKKMVIEEIRRFIKPGRMLELGYINNIWTTALLQAGGSVDILEAASNHVDKAREDFRDDERVRVFHTLFEDYTPEKKYDTILMSGVIKHIPDDVGFLRKARAWLESDGVVIGCTQNSRSFHRRLGTYMGLELAPDAHNKRDKEVFNIHQYDRFKWRALFLQAGYDVDKVQGVFLKILSTEQMMYLGEKYDAMQIMEGLRKLGEELQDYAWYLFLVARLPAQQSAAQNDLDQSLPA
ncbi:MAG TPA: methyltransferase domain-containing protein [Pyrinomonadaceae bacterium]|jgi:SAM-dependent methyltransferase